MMKSFWRRLVIVSVLLGGHLPAIAADDDTNNYRVIVQNRAGETLSLVCNNRNPIPLANGGAVQLAFIGPDGFFVRCIGFDHHREAIAVGESRLDHHHLVHTIVMQRGHDD